MLPEGNKKHKDYGELCNKPFFRKDGEKTRPRQVEAFLDENFGDSLIEYLDDALEAQFSSHWVFPEELINGLVESLEVKDEIYIRVLTYEFGNEYISFRIFSQGEWEIKV